MAGAKGSKQRHRKHGLVALRRAIEGSIDPHSKLGLALRKLSSRMRQSSSEICESPS